MVNWNLVPSFCLPSRLLEAVSRKQAYSVRMEKKNIYTIGHSTHSSEEFLELLGAYEIRCLVDVRTVPKSRKNPQFGIDLLPGELQAVGIEYQHCKELGGLRHPAKDSPNTGWRNTSFRGYADYMASAEFRTALTRLENLARAKRTAIMCAEAVPWRCHRSLIADALVARGIAVEEIVSETRRTPHKLTPFARVDGVAVTYPAIDAGPAD